MGKFKLIIILIIVMMCSVDIVNAKSVNFLTVEANYEDLWSGDLSISNDNSGVVNIAYDCNEYILKPLRYLVPILFLVLTIFDFAKSTFVEDKEGIVKAKNNLGKRIIISIIIFFVPSLVNMLMILFELTS